MNYDLERFAVAQNSPYDGYVTALQEMRNGRKLNHWIWYIFPQLKELGHSGNAKYFGIDGLGEAKAYLEHPVLGARLREITKVVLDSSERDPYIQMGSKIDAQKLKSSMTLFMAAAPGEELFKQVLDKYYEGRVCGSTISIIKREVNRDE